MNTLNSFKWIVLIATALAAFIGFPYYYQQNQINKDRVNQVTQYALIVRDSAIVYKNKYDNAVVQVETARLDNVTMSKLREDLKDITSRFDGVNKRLNNVESLSKTTLSAVTTLEGNLQDTVVVRDSVKIAAYKFSLGDQYYKVTGIATPALKRVTITPSFKANIYAITKWKRKHKVLGIRFGIKEYKSEITSDNPYLEFTDHKIVVKKWD